MPEYKYHPLADLFPLLDKNDLDDLAKDIKDNGQIEPITLYQGEILDGRNRYRACQQLGIEPKITIYEGTKPFEFVISRNLHRRHLTTSQRAMIAAEIANMRHGGDRVSEQARNSSLGTVTQAQAAQTLRVSVDSVKEAVRLKRDAPPDIIKAVVDGEMSLNAARNAIHEQSAQTEEKQSNFKEHYAELEAFVIADTDRRMKLLDVQRAKMKRLKKLIDANEKGVIELDNEDLNGIIAEIDEISDIVRTNNAEAEEMSKQLGEVDELIDKKIAELLKKEQETK